MSTSATAPSNDTAAFILFGLDPRIVPVVSALVAFFVFAILLVTLLCVCHMRRQAALLGDPEYLAALREVELRRLEKEQAGLTTKPVLQILPVDLTQSKGNEKLTWKDIVPLSAETDNVQATTPYSPRTTSRSNDARSEDIRLVTIIMLPYQTREGVSGLEAAFGVIERRVIK